jgi:hypothetical protein
MDDVFHSLTPRDILQLASRLTRSREAAKARRQEGKKARRQEGKKARRQEVMESPCPFAIPAWVSSWHLLWALSLGSMQFRGSFIVSAAQGCSSTAVSGIGGLGGDVRRD